MSIKLMSLVWDLDLPPGDKLVLLALADQANDEGLQCWPAVATIAKRSGQGERTVRRCIADLEAKGHLTRHHRDGNSTQYHIHPCQNGSPAKSAPLPKTTPTPAKLAPKPSRTIKPLVSSNDDTPPVVEKPALKPEHVVEAWNDLAERRGLPKVKALTGVRAKKLRSLIRAHPIEDFTEAISAIERSPFLLGQKDGGWRANFDFLLQPSSFVKLIEGNYDRSH
jgi:hypothetical protein